MKVMCAACEEGGFVSEAVVLAPQSTDGGKTGVYTPACPFHYSSWWDGADWDGSIWPIPLKLNVRDMRLTDLVFDRDTFHDRVISHGFGPPTEAGYEAGKQLYEVGCENHDPHPHMEYYRFDYSRVAAEIVCKGETKEDE